MGFNPIKSITKAAKKLVKSKAGKVALGIGAFLYGPKLFGATSMGGAGGWGQAWKGFSALPAWQKALIGGGLYKGAEELAPEEETVVAEIGDGRAHEDYLRMRKYFLESDPDVWTQKAPMFSVAQGGRVGAQGGMYAGNPMMNRGIGNPMMNQMRGNPMMNQQRGALVGPSALSQNQGLMATQQGNQMRGDPRMMAQLTQGQRTTDIPKQNEDDELIMLIKQLIAMGYEMEQLRGRTKEELVQMMVAASGPVDKGEGEVVEEEEVMTAAGGGLMRPGYAFGDEVIEDVEETENIRVAEGDIDMGSIALAFKQQFGYDMALATPDIIKKFIDDFKEKEGWYKDIPKAEGGLMRTGYALGQPVIPSKDGMQLDMRDTGGYQPHGAQEKKDDVRALLAQGEFVMTSDAVRGLGGGNRDVGAKKMYDMMHNLEAMA